MKEYTKISGTGFRSSGTGLVALSRAYCSLWMGADHLLLVERTGFTEVYKRFYFRDIQAVIIRKTSAATVANVVLGTITLLFAAPALMVSEPAGRIALWSCAGFFGFFLALNLWRGSSCVTHIKTAVQTEELSSWKRLKAARKGLKQIRPFIIQAQGEVPVDELRARLEDALRRNTQGPATGAI